MDKFQEYISSMVLPGIIVDRKYGLTCENQRFCIITTRTVWYTVFLVIEIDVTNDKYKIVNITKQFSQSGANKEVEKTEKIKNDKKKLQEILDMDDYHLN